MLQDTFFKKDLPLLEGTLIRRYKRFLADVELDTGEVVTAHCPNSGKLLGLPEHARVLLSDHGLGGTRKLRYTFEWFLDAQTWVGINTHDANACVGHFLKCSAFPEVSAYSTVTPEVMYGDKNGDAKAGGTRSRIDFLLTHGDERLFLEVKSVHMKRGHTACFPDCPTERGAKHMRQLAKILDEKTKACVLYLVQRDDCDSFGYAQDLDPNYAMEAKAAEAQGVQMLCYAMRLKKETGLHLLKKLPVL